MIVFGLLALFVSSCYVETVEPRYDPRDRVLGYYDVEEYSQTYNDYTYYSMRISKSGYDREVYLHNFYAVDIDVYAVLDYDKITIPFQIVDGYEIEGVGTVYGNELNFNYSVRDRRSNTRKDFCETIARFDY